MKILTILGTRPEIIRLSRIIPKLDELVEHRVLHTGQNYDPLLNDVFFRELRLRNPDRVLASKGLLSEQLAVMFTGTEEYIREFKPDRVLVLGDTNSALTAIIAERLLIPVYHMEAGNRCFDLRVPEEKNRRVIDAISSVNLPYTNNSSNNLLRENITSTVTGNPILEVLNYYQTEIDNSDILDKLKVNKHNYVIATAHRAENVDNEQRLTNIFDALDEISKHYKVIFACHPKTRQRLLTSRRDCSKIIITEPLGFFDFVKLEKEARLAITDSGTVQEEACLFDVATVTIRDTTERPETVECGSNTVTGLETAKIIEGFNAMLPRKNWTPPAEYLLTSVSDTVIEILMREK